MADELITLENRHEGDWEHKRIKVLDQQAELQLVPVDAHVQKYIWTGVHAFTSHGLVERYGNVVGLCLRSLQIG